MHNARIPPIISKVRDITKHIRQLLTDTTGNRILDDLPVETLKAALDAVDAAPDDDPLVPAHHRPEAEKVLAGGNLD